MKLMPIHERMAELRIIQKRRKLTDTEKLEMEHCLDVNADHCLRLAYLYNMSLMASMTEDQEWQYELCKEIERYGGTPNNSSANTNRTVRTDSADSTNSTNSTDNSSGSGEGTGAGG
ncbi:DUF7667 family protein [Paenibacillus sp. MMS18-CY102]|uniref:DUF7667 family protein n=1 Tax=Paenibacillus sp. MMS18-CY102 TaxID=2682849 RepID=UPI001F185360|nr:hypothetical protein [Paenibacillus sp. MMS18-CY102]